VIGFITRWRKTLGRPGGLSGILLALPGRRIDDFFVIPGRIIARPLAHADEAPVADGARREHERQAAIDNENRLDLEGYIAQRCSERQLDSRCLLG
jgi:hypothetical protein